MSRFYVSIRVRLIESACLILCVIFFSGGFLLNGQDWGKISVQSHQLGDRIFALASGAGGNMVVLRGEEGMLLVDSDLSQLHQNVMDALEKISKHPVRILVNTHWHFDHTGGNLGFAEKGCDIYAHTNVRKKMQKKQTIGILNIDVEASPPEALPKMLVEEQLRLEFGHEHILLQHLPRAHTDGDVCVFFKESNVLHTGDLVFNKQYPFIDVYGGGSIDGMINGLDIMIGLCDDHTVIVPGHGPILKRAGLVTYRTMLTDFRDAVKDAIDAGKTLEETQKSPVLTDITEKWGYQHFPPPLFIKMVYLSMQKH